MKNILKASFTNSFLCGIYVVGVAFLMNNGDKIFGNQENFVAPIAFLLLFILSALIVGGLLLGKPIMMYIDGNKKEAIKLFLYEAMWILIFLAIAFILVLIF